MWIWKKKKPDNNDTLKTNGKPNTEIVSGEDLQVETSHNPEEENVTVSGVVFREKDSVIPEESKEEDSMEITESALISVKFRKPGEQTVGQEEKTKKKKKREKKTKNKKNYSEKFKKDN